MTVAVGVLVGVRVTVGVNVLVGVRVTVGVGVFEGVTVIVGVNVFVGGTVEVTVTGVAAFGTIKFGSMVMATLTFYMYGEQAAENVTRYTPLWQAWMQERFPMPAVMDDATP